MSFKMSRGASLLSVRPYSPVSSLETSSARLSQGQEAQSASVNEHFWRKSNEVDGVYRQTLLIACTMLLYFVNSPHCLGQYNESQADSSLFQNKSRTELRQMFLALSPETEVYKLAKESRKKSNWSAVWYSVGGIFLLGGTAAIIENKRANQRDEPVGIHEAIREAMLPAMAITNFSLGAGSLTLGIFKSRKARRKLERAVELYQ